MKKNTLLLKPLLLSFLFFFFSKVTLGQEVTFDTVVTSNTPYHNLKFQLEKDMTFYEVMITDVKIENGKIVKNDVKRDTLGIRELDRNEKVDQYEISLSNGHFTNLLFGKQCSHLATPTHNFPLIQINRDRQTNELTFVNRNQFGEFLKENYALRLECIRNSDDRFMETYISEWIEELNQDSIDQFTTAFVSHFIHIFSFYDLIVPISNDTLVYSVTTRQDEIGFDHSLQVIRTTDKELNTVIKFSDEVPDKKPIKEQLKNSLLKIFDEQTSEEEKASYDIRLNSQKSIDRSRVTIDKNNQFVHYLRIMESSILNANLEPRLTFYNLEIKKVDQQK